MKNRLKGGKGDRLKPKDVNQQQLRMGIKVEMEHTQSRRIAQEIALDHLAEYPDYYTRLAKMEREAEKQYRNPRRRGYGSRRSRSLGRVYDPEYDQEIEEARKRMIAEGRKMREDEARAKGDTRDTEAAIRARLEKSPKFKKKDGTVDKRKIDWFIGKLRDEGQIRSNPPGMSWAAFKKLAKDHPRTKVHLQYTAYGRTSHDIGDAKRMWNMISKHPSAHSIVVNKVRSNPSKTTRKNPVVGWSDWTRDWALDMKVSCLVMMRPRLFVELTSGSEKQYQEIFKEAHPIENYIAWNAEVGGDLPPFLDIDVDTGKIEGHEGRHRCAAAAVSGEKEVPVCIVLRKDRRADRSLGVDDLPHKIYGEYRYYLYLSLSKVITEILVPNVQKTGIPRKVVERFGYIEKKQRNPGISGKEFRVQVREGTLTKWRWVTKSKHRKGECATAAAYKLIDARKIVRVINERGVVLKQVFSKHGRRGLASNPAPSAAVKLANKSARSGGAVSGHAIVPKLVRMLPNFIKSKRILDFGSGNKPVHAQALKKSGYNVTAYDFGDNLTETHDAKALSKKWPLIYASNVLNVQSSRAMANETVASIAKAMTKDGFFLANFPYAPRYWLEKGEKVKWETIERLLQKYFKVVTKVPAAVIKETGAKSTHHVWLCSQPEGRR